MHFDVFTSITLSLILATWNIVRIQNFKSVRVDFFSETPSTRSLLHYFTGMSPLLERAKQLWGGDQSRTFKIGAWVFAGTIAVATSLPMEYYTSFMGPKPCANIKTEINEQQK